MQVPWHKKDLQTSTAEKTEVEVLQEPTWVIDKISPTSGAWYQHILWAHTQVFVWRQDLVEYPNILDPFKLGWLCDADKIPVSILSDIE